MSGITYTVNFNQPQPREGVQPISIEQVTAAARKGLNDAGLTQVTISVVNSGPGSN